MVKQVFVDRIGFRRTRTQRSGTRTRTRWLFEMRRCRSLIEAVGGTWGPIGQIAELDRFEYEYEYEYRDAEYEKSAK